MHAPSVEGDGGKDSAGVGGPGHVPHLLHEEHLHQLYAINSLLCQLEVIILLWYLKFSSRTRKTACCESELVNPNPHGLNLCFFCKTLGKKVCWDNLRGIFDF
jgi:hypothetical protein